MSILHYLFNNNHWKPSDIEEVVGHYRDSSNSGSKFSSKYLYSYPYNSVLGFSKSLWMFISMHHFFLLLYSDRYNGISKFGTVSLELVMFMGNFCTLCWAWNVEDRQEYLDCPGSVIGFDIL